MTPLDKLIQMLFLHYILTHNYTSVHLILLHCTMLPMERARYFT
jgi:hypothetical protein